MQASALILDFDGVVVDSLPAHLKAWADAFVEIFQQPPPDVAELAGHSSRAIADILARRYGEPSMARTLVAAKERALLEHSSPVVAFPGVQRFLDEAQAFRLPYGIASNSSRPFVIETLRRLSLDIPVVLTASDVSRPKPAPDMFWECSNRMGIEPKERRHVLVFEDSPHGIKAAIAAGMAGIGISTTVSPKALLAAGASAVCSSLAEAAELGWLSRSPLSDPA